MRPLDILLAVTVMLVWGVNFAVSKMALGELSPLLLIGLRYLLTALVLLPLLRKPLPVRFGHLLVLSFTLGVLHFGFMFTGLTGVDASLAAVTTQIQVPFAVLAAVVFFGERPGWRRIAGIVLAFVGVAVLAGSPSTASSLGHLGMIIVAALLWGLAHLQIKWMGQIGPFALNAWLAVLAAPQILLASWVIEDGQWEALANAGFAGWGGVLYMALGVTVFGYGLWYRIVQKYSVSQTMPLTILAPVVGAASGVVLLGERMDAYQLLGAICTIAGVAIVTLVRAPRETAPPTREA